MLSGTREQGLAESAFSVPKMPGRENWEETVKLPLQRGLTGGTVN